MTIAATTKSTQRRATNHGLENITRHGGAVSQAAYRVDEVQMKALLEHYAVLIQHGQNTRSAACDVGDQIANLAGGTAEESRL